MWNKKRGIGYLELKRRNEADMYRIIGDSCTDLTKEQKAQGDVHLVPLTLQVEDELFVDDETFDQLSFLKKQRESSECPKSACPSPERYLQEFEQADEVYVVTLSANLSGSYNSAALAKQLCLEEYPEKKIEIIDSKSASVGQNLITMKIKELKEQGLSFDEVVKKVNAFRDQMETKFVLEDLEHLRKNGRLKNMTAVVCSVLNIKPVMAATPEGEICKIDQARGMERALMKMIQYIEADAKDAANRICAIAHCNNKERAEFVKQEIMKRIPFKDCFITDTAGVSTLYANDGGIIVCY